MQTIESPKAGEQTQTIERTPEDVERFHSDMKRIATSQSIIDPVYGFLTSLRDCTFHFSKGQRKLTIKAPSGGKIGLPFVEEIKTLTANRIERNHRIAAPELKRMLLEALAQLEQHDRGTADAVRREYRLEVINR